MIYNTVERIAKKYGYKGNIGTNSLVIKKIFDKSLKELTKKELLAVHPNTNEASLLISFKDLEKLIR